MASADQESPPEATDNFSLLPAVQSNRLKSCVLSKSVITFNRQKI